MRTRTWIALCLAATFFVLVLQFTGLFQSFMLGVHAQEQDQPFWVFDGHMHPVWSVYARGGTLGEANSDGRFTLPLAEQGGAGGCLCEYRHR